MSLFLVLGATVGCPLILYFAARAPEAWGQRAVGLAPVGAGAYRRADAPAWAPADVPAIVRAAAFTSFLLGQILVPGVFAAFAGAAALVSSASASPSALLVLLVLSAPTGLTVAAWLLAAGVALLRRAPEAGARARRGARAQICQYVVVSLALVVAALVDEAGHRGAFVAVALFAAASVGQGLLLLRAARAIESLGSAD